jgi:uncharacterized ion transporter superfamily protein YfcC
VQRGKHYSFKYIGEDNSMWKTKRCLGVFVVVLFVLNFIIPPGVFAQAQQDAEMEKKCAATKAGTEADETTRKACAAYFEQTGAAGAAGAAAGAAATEGMSAGTIALVVLGVAAVGAGIAAAAGGGGGGGSSAVPTHKAPAR